MFAGVLGDIGDVGVVEPFLEGRGCTFPVLYDSSMSNLKAWSGGAQPGYHAVVGKDGTLSYAEGLFAVDDGAALTGAVKAAL